MDIYNVFLNGDLLKEVYMHILDDFANGGDSKGLQIA